MTIFSHTSINIHNFDNKFIILLQLYKKKNHHGNQVFRHTYFKGCPLILLHSSFEKQAINTLLSFKLYLWNWEAVLVDERLLHVQLGDLNCWNSKMRCELCFWGRKTSTCSVLLVLFCLPIISKCSVLLALFSLPITSKCIISIVLFTNKRK